MGWSVKQFFDLYALAFKLLDLKGTKVQNLILEYRYFSIASDSKSAVFDSFKSTSILN